MATSQSSAHWSGDLKNGRGTMRIGDNVYEGAYSFAPLFMDGDGLNPEELLAAAHAGCYSMALAKLLSQAHHRPGRIETTARVHMNQQSDEPVISLIELDTQAEMSAIDEQEVQRHAEAAKVGCPVSKLFAGADIRLRPMLVTR